MDVLIKNSYKIIEQDRLIIETFFGKFSFLQFTKLKRKILQDKQFKDNYNYIIDIRESVFTEEKKYKAVLHYLELYTYKIKPSKCAILANSPSQVVEAMLLSEEATLLPVEFKTFSEPKSAYKWIYNDCAIRKKSITNHIHN